MTWYSGRPMPSLESCYHVLKKYYWNTAMKIPFMYSFLGIAQPQFQFPHLCAYERFIYSQDRSVHIQYFGFPAAEYADQSWEYINRSQTHECRNWDCGHAIPFLGIFVSNFRYCIFAVKYKNHAYTYFLSSSTLTHLYISIVYTKCFKDIVQPKKRGV
jgi:hypothetical protein